MLKTLLNFLAIAFCIGFLSSSCKAQENDFQYGLMNVGIGGVIGGIGAVINKKPEQKLGKTLLKGLGQGALGGYLVFESKRLVREFAEHRNYNLIWPSKLLNAAGSSIIENAAANRDFWERWHLNLGFNRFEVDVKDNFKLRYRIMPVSLSQTIYVFSQARLDVDRSMVFGTFVFFAEKPIMMDDLVASGAAYSDAILLERGLFQGERVEAHEIVHVYQNEAFLGVNMILNKPVARLERNNKFIHFYNRLFYTDLNTFFRQGISSIEKSMYGYHQSSFEKEARYFGYTR